MTAQGEETEGGLDCSGRIVVAVRIRPCVPMDGDDYYDVGCREAVTVVRESNSCRQLRIDTDEHAVRATFDAVFPPESSQEDVYRAVKRVCVDSALEGLNATLFAYGQTGSGKTYTIFGPEDDRTLYGCGSTPPERAGIIPRVIRDVLWASANDESMSIFCSFAQVYNEQVFDLLRDPFRRNPIKIHESSDGGVHVEGISEYLVGSASDCLALVERGDENRVSRRTHMNDVSSRSHSIFQIIIEQAREFGRVVRSKINICDLAGSERWDIMMRDMNDGHVRELTNINTSLHTLGRCIAALSANSGLASSHIPYRESKLTRLLRDSLGGNARTCLLAAVSPIERSVDETISTLKFADRAKRVKVHAEVVETRVIDEALVCKLEDEIKRLREVIRKNAEGGQVAVSSSAPRAPRQP